VEEVPLGWKKKIPDYLKHKILPPDKSQARNIRMQAVRYTLLVDELHRRGFSSPLLKCLD